MPLRSSSANHSTLEVPSSSSTDLAKAEGACCHVAFVQGSTPQLSGETQSLLRSRLRAAALLLGMGFGVFFLRNLFYTDYASLPELLLLIFHGLVTVTLLVTGGFLCHRCVFQLSTLRRVELIVFGLPAVFFVAMQWYTLARSHAIKPGEMAYFESPAAPWVLLIFTYCLYIPNTWRRAAWIVGAMALAPTAMFVFFWLDSPHLYEAVSFLQVSQVALMSGLAAIAGVWGVYTIGRLRQEAFEARQLGQYHLKRLLGAGGMGEVYLAEHQLMKRPCAIKLIKPGSAADPKALARFEREVRSSARLTHWNTIEIFDYGRTDDGTFYYVMEYLPGKSLADLVAQHGPLPPERVISLLTQICEALAEAHSIGIIHRDIKPGNIFAAERGGVYDVAKLLDFGLAKPLIKSADIALTQEGALTGSPLFMAPEQAAGDGTPDARSDIYALGGVAYYLLTGQPPFQFDNPIKVLMAHASEPVVPPSRLRTDIPEDLERIVLRCLEKDATRRFSSTLELAAALGACSVAGRWTREMAREWWVSNGGVETAQPSCETVLSPVGTLVG